MSKLHNKEMYKGINTYKIIFNTILNFNFDFKNNENWLVGFDLNDIRFLIGKFNPFKILIM